MDKAAVAASPAVSEALAAAQAELNSSGRVLLARRAPNRWCRVMVEAATAEDAQRIAERVAAVVGQS